MGIKPSLINTGSSIKSPTIGIEELRKSLNNHPVFCFQFLQKGFALEECSDKDKIFLIKRICDLSTFKWSEIHTKSRKALGSEKIPYSAIKVPKPAHISKDTEFLVFRFGNTRRLIGYTNAFIFHVVYIDPLLKVYKH